MKEEQINKDDEIFKNLSNTLGYGIRFENGDFESSSSEAVRKLVPLSKCRDCDLLLHEREDVERPGRCRDNVKNDGEKHSNKYEHTVDVILEDGNSYKLMTYNPR